MSLMEEARKLVELSERCRKILLNFDYVTESQISRAIGIPQRDVRRALEFLASNKQAQKGNRGWRAL